NTKKYYYECVGQGQRYEAFEFVRLISQNPSDRIPLHTREEVRAVTELVERFHSGDVATLGCGPYVFGGGEKVDDR
ncbi:MAG: glycerol-3-phosphate cytidylyltransferase, partial [Eggerthellaceae bacterium]